MKYIFFIVALLATVFAKNTFAQSTETQAPSSQILSLYYNIKDALIAGNAIAAASCAEAFLKSANEAGTKSISESSINALIKDASAISKTKDLKEQRVRFADLSTNMFAAVKATKLTDQPVYQAYCPMQKALWLSNSRAIKNPYYGSAMLTCGKVVETINQ